MILFSVRRGFDARKWYRTDFTLTAEDVLDFTSDWMGEEWIDDGVTEYEATEAIEIIGPSGVVLTSDGKGAWWNAFEQPVKDPLTYMRNIEASSPPDDNITDGGELLRLKALRQAVIDEITWHNNEAAHHREAAAECTDEDYTAEHWGHTLDAHCHDKAAKRLRAILNGAVPPEPEAAS
jgi:hypothetical protein